RRRSEPIELHLRASLAAPASRFIPFNTLEEAGINPRTTLSGASLRAARLPVIRSVVAAVVPHALHSARIDVDERVVVDVAVEIQALWIGWIGRPDTRRIRTEESPH